VRGDGAESPTSWHSYREEDSSTRRVEVLQMEGASGKMNSCIVDRVYDRQFGLCGIAIHEAVSKLQPISVR
jgi:hypothetical protein